MLIPCNISFSIFEFESRYYKKEYTLCYKESPFFKRDLTMHELSLCQTILDIVNDHVAKINCRRIKKICLEVGQLAAVDKDALLFSFNVVATGTVAENASLEIIDVEGWAICDFCQKTVRLKHYYDACEACDQFSLKIIQGEELRIKFMEVE